MQTELVIFMVMISVFVFGTFLLKIPSGVSMLAAAVLAAPLSGNGLPLRHFVEGTFVFLDTNLIIATSTIFMKFIQESGTLEGLNSAIIKRFGNNRVLLLLFLMLVIMFPGMITGAYTTAVIVAASMVAPVLAEMGIPKVEITAIIALGSTLGMIAPPVNIPAMLMGGGIDMPFVGFGVPLLLLTLPLAVFSMLYLSLKHVSRKETDLRDVFCSDVNERYGFKVYLPIIVVVLFMSINKLLPGVIPDIGLPLTFVIGSIVAIFTGKKINILKSAKEAVYMSLPVMGVLAGVGILIQIMTLTGVRGFIVIRSLDIPEYLLYLVIAAVVPLLGAISTFGSASVLGVPLLLALISKNQIIVASALSLLAGIGGLLPPLGFFAADAVGNDYNKVLKAMVVPIVIYMILSVLFIVFANQLAAILF